jgi:hypothetical protein
MGGGISVYGLAFVLFKITGLLTACHYVDENKKYRQDCGIGPWLASGASI